MGYRHAKDELLDSAVESALEQGLSRLTFGSLARRLGISDRTLVYYFPTKDDLLSEVLAAIGSRLQDALGPALTSPVADHLEFVESVWPTISAPRFDRVFAVYFEARGLAAAGLEPYRTMASALVQDWITWADQWIDGDADWRRTETAAAIAALDGLLLLRQLAGAATADRAAAGMLPESRRAG